MPTDSPDLTVELRHTAQWAALLVARLLPLATFTPIFGGELAPRRFRFALALLLAVPLALASDTSSMAGVDGPGLALLLAKEALVGAVLAALVVALFETFAATGALVDLARGASMASMLDPLTKQHAPPLAGFMRQFALVCFLSIGGYGLLMLALIDSLTALPPHEIVPSALIGPDALGSMLALLADLCLVAAQLALPVFIALLGVDLAAGIIGRTAPQIEMFHLTLPAKAMLGLFILMLTLGHVSEGLDDFLGRTLHAIAGGWR